jgi:GH43 family beta-xylosidase
VHSNSSLYQQAEMVCLMLNRSRLKMMCFFALNTFLLMLIPKGITDSQMFPTEPPSPPATTQTITNPLIEQRADPWVYLHSDGYYYFTASVPAYDRIEVRRAQTIAGLASAEAVTVWTKRPSGILSKHIWAPEIHFIDGKWYIYFAAARVDAPFDHRIYALENESANPLEGEWIEKGQVKTNWESFALDATSFEHNGVRYFVWAQRDPAIPGNSNLYIAPMSNPWTIEGEQVMLSKPEFDWEVIGFLVNEGAAVLKRNGKIFITYSASATDFNYAMGMLTAPDDSDLLDPASWSKSPEPVFKTNEANGQYGPGHNSFTVSPEGQDLMVYHARNYKDIVGDPLNDPNRHTRVQPFTWNADGTPNFGVPVPDGVLSLEPAGDT